MPFEFTEIKRHKRGATYDDGTTVLCVTCRADETRRRSNQAMYTALVVNNGYKLPVGYCDQHVPDEVKERAR